MKSFISSRLAVSALTLLASVSFVKAEASPSDTPSTATVAASEPAESTVVGTATVDGKTLQVTYGEVKGKLKLLPPQLQNAPLKEIFPLLLKSVLTEKVISHFAEKAGTKNDADYQKMVAECQKGVLQKLFLDKQVALRITDDKLKEEYEKAKNSAPKEDEYDIGLITVTDKKKADEVLKSVKKQGVSKFAEVANKESMNKIPDGNLGFISLGELPPAFREKVKGAANATIIPNVVELSMPDPSDSTKKVTTYNILMVKDKRPTTFPPFEAVKDQLKTAPQITAQFTKEVIKELEGKAEIKLFTMEGKPLDQSTDTSKTTEAPKTTDTQKPTDTAKTDAPKADDKNSAAPAA